ncbi:MAG TPA: cytochrome P460 family protein [Nitrospirota bacterium]|nr:cytochrome P460 family protein [Nitrospirota bacterium]
MKIRNIPAIILIVAMFATLGSLALAAQDKYTLQVQNGLAFSEFRGYEEWQVVAVSQTEDLLKVIVANPTMIGAYRAGIPGNGKPFPDGSKIAKIEWNPKKSAESPFSVRVPDTLKQVGFIMKDAKRFPDSGGWGYAPFGYDSASGKFTPSGSGTNCGFACHTIVKGKDFIFTAYPAR